MTKIRKDGTISVTKTERKKYIENHCEVINLTLDECVKFFGEVGKEIFPWIFIVSKDTKCYLTAGTNLETIYSEGSVIDLLIYHGINHVESIFQGEYPVGDIGYSEKENKWYGWSHRGKCGFTIGSEVKKGHVAYRCKNKEEYENYMIDFYCGDGDHLNARIENRTDETFDIVSNWSDDPKLVPNEKIRGKETSVKCYYPKKYGCGEWIAKTMDDAKQMAIDYAENIA